MSNQAQYDVIVVGGGPAGSSAAIYAARGKRKTLVIDRLLTQGAIGSMGLVTNYPGFFDAINGAQLIGNMRQQSIQLGAEIKQSEVKKVQFTPDEKKVTTADGQSYSTKAVILATGCMNINYSVPGERELYGKGVHYSALQAGRNYEGLEISVFGKSRETAEEALYLARFAKKIYFIIPGNKLDVKEQLQNKLRQNKNIEPIFSASLKKINGDTKMESLTILRMGQDQELQAKAIFLYTHTKRPLTDFLEGTVELSEDGCIKVTPNLESNIPGVFACGDALCGDIQQPIISAAQGAIAAISADQYLQSLEQ